ncbi:MAG: hypothetical protein WCR87_03150 [Saccharofermentanales bacterium]
MDIECVQVLKTLRAGKNTIQPGIYHAPLDRILIDEVRAGGRSVVVIDAKQIASAASTTAAPVSAFKNEIKRLNAICEGLKADLKKETEALERCSETYVESVSQCNEATEAFESLSVSFESLEVAHKELQAENEDLQAENEDLKIKNEKLLCELDVQADNVNGLLDEKDRITEKRQIKKGKK